MKKVTQLLSAFFSVFIFLNLSAQDLDYRGFPEWSWGKEDTTQYMLYTPKNMEPGKVYPIALFMHGCCGKTYDATVRNEVDPPARMWHNFGANTQRIPTYIISAATSRGWAQHFENLKKVIDDLIKNGQGDPSRIYVTGFSMGGGGTWQIIQKYPDYFAAALPMGMDFRGDQQESVTKIPIWTNQGETDWHARGLKDNVAKMRILNGDTINGGATWATGVNPIYSSFKGVGHGVQWVAASRQDLVGWAYSKVNDGNVYPNVFFESPKYKEPQEEGKSVVIKVNAKDPDGSIKKVEIFANGHLLETFKREPFEISFIPEKGDAKLKAIAYDNGGKTNTAQTVVRVDNSPKLTTVELPYARVGALYQKQLLAKGNGPIQFSVDYDADRLPLGLFITKDGLIKGIPEKAGNYAVSLVITDEDGDSSNKLLSLEVLPAREGEIIVTHAINKFNGLAPVYKTRLGEVPNYNSEDDQMNFSNLNGFEELTLIQTDVRDVEVADDDYLSFVINEEATVFVAYEKYDFQYISTIPEWLQSWEKVEGAEIVTQIRYFDVFKKTFPKGKVTIPGGNIKENKVRLNYFVMVKGMNDMDYSPEITNKMLPSAELWKPYNEQLNCLYGKGKVKWELVSGKLPKGLELCGCGAISGMPEKKGEFKFSVMATDNYGGSSVASLSIKID